MSLTLFGRGGVFWFCGRTLNNFLNFLKIFLDFSADPDWQSFLGVSP